MKRFNRIFRIAFKGKIGLAKRIHVNIINEIKKAEDLARQKEILELLKLIKEDELKIKQLQSRLISLNT